MICRTYPLYALKGLKYVVILSSLDGRLLLSRHRERTTWETQGGHIEPGETPLEAARRELYEESGALRYELSPLCDYWAGDDATGVGAAGRVYCAVIGELGPMPRSEMAQTRLFDALPENLTYPAITPVLMKKAKEAGKKMTLETQRLILRPWQESDAEELYRHAKDPAVGPAAGWPPHTSVENSREIIRSVLSAEGTFAVVLKETGKAVGSVGVMRRGAGTAPMEEDEAEIGYWIGRDFWGQGLIPEAVRALLRLCFEELGCTGVWCGYYEGNEKSRRVQEKCGFVPHHCEEGRLCAKMGDVRTEYYTYMARSRWLAAAGQD